MNKRTRALTKEQYLQVIDTIKNGFTTDTHTFTPNERLATVLVTQANFGCRISDILALRLCDIIKNGSRYELNITEQKTGKKRCFTVPEQLVSYLHDYANKNRIHPERRLFDCTERAIQKQLKLVCDFLGLEGISTHSFRKFYATEIYTNNDYDIELVRYLLQHSSAAITQKYIGISTKRIENAINNHLCIV